MQPPRKVIRTAKAEGDSNKGDGKRQVGGLKDLLEMPVDIISEVSLCLASCFKYSKPIPGPR